MAKNKRIVKLHPKVNKKKVSKMKKSFIEQNLEIEKRFLLKRLPRPTSSFGECHLIHQYYGPTGRLREVEICKRGKKRVLKFIRTNKKSLGKGVNHEIEVEISKEVFELELKKCTKHLYKTRYIKKVGKYKWEIDVFSFDLVIAEVEMKTRAELKTIKVPNFMKTELIADITGVKPFSNFNLAYKWKKKS